MKCVLTVIGKDKPGIIAKVSALLAENNVNIEDISQSIVQGYFTMIMLCNIKDSPLSLKEIIGVLNKVGEEYEILDSANRENGYYVLEGYLFPETYDFYSYDSAECAVLAVRKMLEESEARFTDKMRARAKKMGYTVNEILTMASIIQMESGQNATEMPNVAAVFYNRLKSDSFKTLGSSPTCYYGDSFKDDAGRYFSPHDIKNTMDTMFSMYQSAKNNGKEITLSRWASFETLYLHLFY